MSRPCRSNSREKRRSQAGLTLIESAAVFGVTGCVLAAFIPTFLGQVRLSKVAEAADQLRMLHDATAAYYGASHRIEGKLLRMCLPDSAGPTPPAPAVYPMQTDFAAKEATGSATWSALGLTTAQVRYSYQVLVASPGCGLRENAPQTLVTFRAEGDLDGDGVRSSLERTASASSDQTQLKPGPLLHVSQRVE